MGFEHKRCGLKVYHVAVFRVHVLRCGICRGNCGVALAAGC